jgi:hypothetical protein
MPYHLLLSRKRIATDAGFVLQKADVLRILQCSMRLCKHEFGKQILNVWSLWNILFGMTGKILVL